MTEPENQASKPKVLDAANPCQIGFSTDDQTGRGTSTHFSERGILILCNQPLALNRKVKMTLQFPDFRTPVEVQGEVVWTNVYGSNDPLTPRGMGVKFINLEKEVERLLGDLAGQYEVLDSMYSCYFT